jgi:hypothetical protein
MRRCVFWNGRNEHSLFFLDVVVEHTTLHLRNLLLPL